MTEEDLRTGNSVGWIMLLMIGCVVVGVVCGMCWMNARNNEALKDKQKNTDNYRDIENISKYMKPGEYCVKDEYGTGCGININDYCQSQHDQAVTRELDRMEGK